MRALWAIALALLAACGPVVVEALERQAKAWSGDATRYMSEDQFNRIFLHTGDSVCSPGFYTYAAFKAAVAAFPTFATAADDTTNKRELAGFLAQISHETTGGWPTAPDGPHAWGLCFIREGGNGARPIAPYCAETAEWPCAPGKQYYGRGPMQLSWNYNYIQAGKALGVDLLNQPDLVAQDAVLAFKTALWFWMTPQFPKPSCHDVMTGGYQLTQADINAKRTLGFGLTTNIINGGLECGMPTPPAVTDRIGYYTRYAGLLGVSIGSNLDCSSQVCYGCGTPDQNPPPGDGGGNTDPNPPISGGDGTTCAADDKPCNFCKGKAAIGLYPDLPSGCKNFYFCSTTTGAGAGYFRCSDTLLFNDLTKNCDWPSSVTCPAVDNPNPPPDQAGSSKVPKYLTQKLWNQIFRYTSNPACSPGFYSYAAFLKAAAAFPNFASESKSDAVNKRDLAAFLGQISQETTGGWATAPGGRYAWGLCFKQARDTSGAYCIASAQWPCAPGKKYYGRGPIQLTWNYNYIQAGNALGLDLLNNPDLITSDPVVAFKVALWFWMTPQAVKPSCHDVILGNYKPTPTDTAAGRKLGFGWTTLIINGGVECGVGRVGDVQNGRIGHYKRVAKLLGIKPATNVDCKSMQPYQ